MGSRPHIYSYDLDASWTGGSYLVAFTRSHQGSYTIRGNRNAVVSVDGGSYMRMPPSDCESLCRATWDLLRQVEPLSSPASRQ
jgi:hypothetical protein